MLAILSKKDKALLKALNGDFYWVKALVNLKFITKPQAVYYNNERTAK